MIDVGHMRFSLCVPPDHHLKWKRSEGHFVEFSPLPKRAKNHRINCITRSRYIASLKQHTNHQPPGSVRDAFDSKSLQSIYHKKRNLSRQKIHILSTIPEESETSSTETSRENDHDDSGFLDDADDNHDDDVILQESKDNVTVIEIDDDNDNGTLQDKHDEICTNQCFHTIDEEMDMLSYHEDDLTIVDINNDNYDDASLRGEYDEISLKQRLYALRDELNEFSYNEYDLNVNCNDKNVKDANLPVRDEYDEMSSDSSLLVINNFICEDAPSTSYVGTQQQQDNIRNARQKPTLNTIHKVAKLFSFAAWGTSKKQVNTQTPVGVSECKPSCLIKMPDPFWSLFRRKNRVGTFR